VSNNDDVLNIRDSVLVTVSEEAMIE